MGHIKFKSATLLNTTGLTNIWSSAKFACFMIPESSELNHGYFLRKCALKMNLLVLTMGIASHYT